MKVNLNSSFGGGPWVYVAPSCDMKIINFRKETQQESCGSSQVGWSCLGVTHLNSITSTKKYFKLTLRFGKCLFNLIIPSLREQKPDIAVIHVEGNNATYKNYDVDELAGSIVYLGKKCSQSGVFDIVTSAILVKRYLKVNAIIRKVNNKLDDLC